jgi:hypothetical protein
MLLVLLVALFFEVVLRIGRRPYVHAGTFVVFCETVIHNVFKGS